MQILNSTQMNKSKQKFGMVMTPEVEAAHLLRQLMLSAEKTTVDEFEKVYGQVEKSQAENKIVNIKFKEASKSGSLGKICLELVHRKTEKILTTIQPGTALECTPKINGVQQQESKIISSDLGLIKEMLLFADKAASAVEERLLPHEKSIFNTTV